MLAVAAATAGSCFCAAGVEAQHAPDPPAITVNGHATVEVEPDLARVTLGVETEAPGAVEAQTEASRIAAQVASALAEAGVPSRSVRTSRITLYPVYDRRSTPEEKAVLRGYRAANTLAVELEDLSTVGPVIDAAIEAGANHLEGVAFELRDPADARDDALGAAIADARRRAGAIASALEVTLGPVLETTEQGTSVPIPYAIRGEALMAQDASTPVEPGRIRVTAAVTVRYEIDPGGEDG